MSGVKRRGVVFLSLAAAWAPAAIFAFFGTCLVAHLVWAIFICPETKGLIDARRLKLMKSSAILVNTSRGPVVDEEALADALDAGEIGGAAIDVMCDEPPDANSRLLRHPKCIVTPHVAAFSCDFEKNFFEYSVEKLRSICNAG